MDKNEVLWIDDNEPKCAYHGTLVSVHVPGHRAKVNCQVLVYHDGLIELNHFTWFGVTGPKAGGYLLGNADDRKIWDAGREVLGWLQEWDLIELRPIGPEDSEYFACLTLMELAQKVK